MSPTKVLSLPSTVGRWHLGSKMDKIKRPWWIVTILLLSISKPSEQLDNLRKTINVRANAPKIVKNLDSNVKLPPKFLNEIEEKAYHAIEYLHHQMDDDQSGNVDLNESDEFIREELDNSHGQSRQKNFHQNDYQISVQELWGTFKQSPVYNWTVDDVVDWLQVHVDLPDYEATFREKGIDGLHLPLLAANQDHYFTKTMGRFPVDVKRKVVLKATDVVIFGPPNSARHSLFKDVLLGVAIVVASSCAWFADSQTKQSKRDLSRMQSKMEALSKTEADLRELQDQLKVDEEKNVELELSRAKDAKEKANLMAEIERVEAEADKLKALRLNSREKEERLQLAEEELTQVRTALKRAEEELQLVADQEEGNSMATMVSKDLHSLLQKTYKREIKAYLVKKAAAEKSLAEAKDFCDKVRKKRESVLTMMSMPHGGLIDKVDERIQDARHALEELGEDLRERRQRWQRIEGICGVTIRTDVLAASSTTFVHGLDAIAERDGSPSIRSSGSLSSSTSSHLVDGGGGIPKSLVGNSAKRRSVASMMELTGGGGGGSSSGSPSTSRGGTPVSFYLSENSPTSDSSSSTATAARRLSDISFRRATTLPKGHPRFDILKESDVLTDRFLRASSDIALFKEEDDGKQPRQFGSPKEGEEANRSSDESGVETPTTPSQNGHSTSTSSSSSSSSSSRRKKPSSKTTTTTTTPLDAITTPTATTTVTEAPPSGSPTSSSPSRESSEIKSTKKNKAKKLLSKFLSREKINEVGKEDKLEKVLKK